MALVMTVNEVAAELRRSRAHVYRLIAAGKLRTVEPGRVAVDSLHAYCAAPQLRRSSPRSSGFVAPTADDLNRIRRMVKSDRNDAHRGDRPVVTVLKHEP